jgi:hypothetical protein
LLHKYNRALRHCHLESDCEWYRPSPFNLERMKERDMLRRLLSVIILVLGSAGVAAAASPPTADVPPGLNIVVTKTVKHAPYAHASFSVAVNNADNLTPEARARIETLASRLQRAMEARPRYVYSQIDPNEGEGGEEGNNKIIVWLCIATFWDGAAGAACAVYFAGQELQSMNWDPFWALGYTLLSTATQTQTVDCSKYPC